LDRRITSLSTSKKYFMVNKLIEKEDLETLKKGVDPFWVEMSFRG
jgi:hypothetical protein